MEKRMLELRNEHGAPQCSAVATSADTASRHRFGIESSDGNTIVLPMRHASGTTSTVPKTVVQRYRNTEPITGASSLPRHEIPVLDNVEMSEVAPLAGR